MYLQYLTLMAPSQMLSNLWPPLQLLLYRQMDRQTDRLAPTESISGCWYVDVLRADHLRLDALT